MHISMGDVLAEYVAAHARKSTLQTTTDGPLAVDIVQRVQRVQ